MDDVDFSDDFCRFLQTTIPAVEAAELLLLLRSRPETELGATEAAAKLGPGVSAADVERFLDLLRAGGLLSRSPEGRFRYSAHGDAAAHAERLASAYTQRPVTLIRVIYALRDSSIRSFAEAFKLRK